MKFIYISFIVLIIFKSKIKSKVKMKFIQLDNYAMK